MLKKKNKAIIFGISGSISAYKSLEVIRSLRKKDFTVYPILSSSANKFVTEWSVETLAENPILNDELDDGIITHIELCKKSNIFVICPASANTIAKIAHGIANDLLSQTFLGFTGKKIIFPSMHSEMFNNPMTQANIQKCKAHGIDVIEPSVGDLSSGDVGSGRLPHPDIVTQVIDHALYPNLRLDGKKVIITCGGTSEYIDPVRKITNMSSGKSGHVLANAASLNGADVTLIRTIKRDVLQNVHCIDVESSDDLGQALMAQANQADVLIMNAAISDFTIKKSHKKLARKNINELPISPTRDILADFNQACKKGCFSIGFCLSDDKDLVTVTQRKLIEKNCDMMVANGTDSFGKNTRTVDIIDKDSKESFCDISLGELAYRILSKIVAN